MLVSGGGNTMRVGKLNLHVDDQGGAAPALLFLHYWGGSGRTWSAVIDVLVSHFRCIAVDLRGWGRSGRRAKNYSLSAQASDIERLIASLRLEDFVLVGHSMGGKIAQIVAAHRPPGLRAVVLVAPAPPTPLLVADDRKQAMLDSYASREGVLEALQILANRPLSVDQREQVMEDTLGGADGAKRAWVESGMGLDISQQARAIQVPVQVILGAADQVEREPALRQAFAPLLPQARFEVLEGVGHLSPLEAPRSVAEAILDFLAA
jgi:pimeloyl-ACP methyl ester carboxylesterase